MAYPNGRIPGHALKQLPGRNAGLLKPYAYAYWAWHYQSLKRGGPPLTIIDGPVGRTYRSYARQVLAKRVYGSNAATPGSSNHGLGRAVDLMTQGQRSSSDRWGAPYGWLKAWSDASWEWWHLRGVKAMGPPSRPDPLRVLKGKDKRAAQRLLYHRREMAREKRTGQGPRYRRQLRWARYWKDRVARRMNSLHSRGHGGSPTYQTLKKVMHTTDGRM